MTRPTIGIIGVGAFGALMAKHMAPHAPLILHDPNKDLTEIAASMGTRVGDIRDAAECPLVLVAVPVQAQRAVLHHMSPFLKPGAVVMDVASVKLKPTQLMLELLPPDVSIVGTHPLFGPQSGKNGIAGLNIAICNVRGNRDALVTRFLRHKLKLNVFNISPEEHDRQMAYVQGLTHLIAKVVVSLDLPQFQMTTKTFGYMQSMVDMVRYDSDELFRAIARENPFVQQAKDEFFAAVDCLEERLGE